MKILSLSQIEALAVSLYIGSDEIIISSEFVQPLLSVTVIIYVPPVETCHGMSVLPVFHKYVYGVVPPDTTAVRAIESPLQKAVSLPSNTEGKENTVSVVVITLSQLFAASKVS